MELKFRQLKPSELELKPCQFKKDKTAVQMLVYTTSRAIMDIYDTTFGENWQSDYKMVGDNLFCIIRYKNSEGEWVQRMDTGDASASAGISPEKSLATSAFKRVATQIGVGRYLYTCPKIWINLNAGEVSEDGKRLYTNFSVKELKLDDTESYVKSLIIIDDKGKVRYSTEGKGSEVVESNPSLEYNEGGEEPKSRVKLLKEFCVKLREEFPDSEDSIREFYKKQKEKVDMIKKFNYSTIRKFYINDYEQE